MITLGIETSCDETACAILENKNTLRSNIISSSLKKHIPFGGVVPEIASRHTLENIDTVYHEALKKAHVSLGDIGLISVTYGPGLIGSLLVGVAFAKALALSRQIPLIGVNHLHAHIYANFIDMPVPRKPFIGLVVSGGHTSVVLCDNGRFQEIATTRDDACGEAFDKVAKMLGLGYPGGPRIEHIAKSGNPDTIVFKCGQFKGSYDFSFSGIKTAVLYYAERSKNLKEEIPHICAAFQKSVIEDIVLKTIQLAEKHAVSLIAVGGGVSANKVLRERLTSEAATRKMRVLFPQFENSLDNAAMVARYGYAQFKRGRVSDLTLAAVPNLAMGCE